jgi:hypothetical protein
LTSWVLFLGSLSFSVVALIAQWVFGPV